MRDIGNTDGTAWVGVVIALLLIALGGSVLVYRTSSGVDAGEDSGPRRVTIGLTERFESARALIRAADRVDEAVLPLN
ncbi:MAG TPA: hypothetical protein VF463_07480 [Sphingobium sp.]